MGTAPFTGHLTHSFWTGPQGPPVTQQGFWGPKPAAFALVFFPDLPVVLVGMPICLFNVYAADPSQACCLVWMKV